MIRTDVLLRPAGARTRGQALFIDGLLFLPLYFLEQGVVTADASQAAVFTYYLLTWQLGWLYTTALHGWRGQTLGKALVGIRVVRSDTGGRLGWGRAVLRDLPIILLTACCSAVWVCWNAAYFLGFGSDEVDRSAGLLLTALNAADLLWAALEVVTMLAHPQRRAVHDLIAGSVVVAAETPPPGGGPAVTTFTTDPPRP